MSPADKERLRELYRRESRSLLQYVLGASPYAAGTDRKLLDEVTRIGNEESDTIRELHDFLASHRVTPPHLGAFPVAFMDLNFVSIRFLLPKLITEQRRDLTALEADHAETTDPAGRELVQRLVELHRRHLKELEGLTA